MQYVIQNKLPCTFLSMTFLKLLYAMGTVENKLLK